MPSKKKKFNSRFPPARIKKIMQTDEEVGKVAAAVPVLISKALEHFIEGLLLKASQQTLQKNAKTLTTSHIKQCIHREKTFDFLKDLVENVPDLQNANNEDNNGTTSSISGNSKKTTKTTAKRRKRKGPGTSSSSDEESQDEEDNERSEDTEEDGHLSHPPQTASHQAPPEDSHNVQYTQNNAGTTSSQVQSYPGPSNATFTPQMFASMSNFARNQGFTLGQYKPRQSKLEEMEEEEDYDT